jgi:putative ABC transport system permease protein
MSFWSRFKNAVRPDALDVELQNEVETHIALIEADEIKRGASPEAARAYARQRFGNTMVHREVTRDRDLFAWVEQFVQDARFSIRQLARVPGFTLTTVLLLALGIGVNAAIFTLLNSVVLHSLPLPDADRLLVLLERMPGGGDSPPSWLDQKDFREQNHVLESLAAFSYGSSMLLRNGNETNRVVAGYVTPDYFSTMGVKPVAGRLFETSEAKAGSDAVVLVREDYWRTALNGDPAILGKQLEVNGRKCEVIGMLPESFRFPSDTAVVWAPLVPKPNETSNRGWHGFPLVGRLKPGVSMDQARTELSAIMKNLSQQYPNANTDRTAVNLYPMQRWKVGDAGDRLLVLQCAAFAVFLMTCANVSSLLLARYSSRRREFALRAALGASGFRQVRQHLTECLMLAGIGCVAGSGVAYGGVQFLLKLYGGGLPRANEIGVDARLIWFTVGVAMAGALAFGLTTAWHGRANGLELALREGGHLAGSRKGAIARKVLVAAQVACAVTLVSAAAELIRSFDQLTSVRTGIEMDNLLTMRVSLPDSKYTTAQRANEFLTSLIGRLNEAPGIASAAVINMLPIQQFGYNGDINVPGLPPHPSSFYTEFRWVAGDYLKTMGVPLVRGRNFQPEELSGQKNACIINQTLAKTLWGDRDPIGWSIGSKGPDGTTVVGVAQDVRQSGLNRPPGSELILPLSARNTPITEQSLVVRSKLAPSALTTVIRKEIAALDSEVALYRIKPMQEVVSDSVGYARITTTLLSMFAGLALLLAAFGLYGVMSYVVRERMREFAIRVAIGAGGAQLISMVVRQSMTMVGVGLATGLVGVISVKRVLPSLLAGVKGIDVVSVAASVGVLAAAAVVALVAPACRATRVDPILTLRQE